jgi:glyoxylase-like metal-dependent hydrolase (beta-lactamase superfamily II)
MQFEENKVFEIRDGVWIRNAVDNSVWADLGDGVVVIDGLEDPGLATVIQQCIADTVGKPMKWLINTHWHGDHIACNPAWARAGATVIAHESMGPATTARDGQPDIVFPATYVLQGRDRRVELEWLGGTHTPWDTVVYFPWAKVLHIADLFGWGMIPLGQMDWGKVPRLRQVLARVLEYDADVLIPGHGPLLTRDHIRRWLTYFEDLASRVPARAAAGATAEQIQREIPPPTDMADWWKLADWKHARNIQMLATAPHV